MFNFVNRLFGWDSVSSIKHVKDEKKDINAPVYTIVEAYRRNPKRFYISIKKDKGEMRTCYTVFDSNLDLVFIFEFNYDEEEGCSFKCISHTMFTSDECEYLYKEFVSIYSERQERYKNIINKRQRRHLVNLYKV